MLVTCKNDLMCRSFLKDVSLSSIGSNLKKRLARYAVDYVIITFKYKMKHDALCSKASVYGKRIAVFGQPGVGLMEIICLECVTEFRGKWLQYTSLLVVTPEISCS